MGIPILPTISTTRIVISAILIVVGWRLIWKREVGKHKNIILTVAIFTLTFFLTYASRTIFIGNTASDGPASAKRYCTIFLFFHINLAAISDILGLVQTIAASKDKYGVHRKFEPFASVIWFCIVITGIVVYLLLYVLCPGGETTSLIKATFGH